MVISALSHTPTRLSRGHEPVRTAPPPAVRAASTGFVLYVDLDPDHDVTTAELQRAAQTLRELAIEWLPRARTRTVLHEAHRTGPATLARPATGSLRASLASIPDSPTITLHLGGRRVTVGGRSVRLSPKEFDLLAHLVGAGGRVVSRDELRRTVWSDSEVSTSSRTVDVHVRRLRAVPELAGLVTTVHGVGYRVASRAGLQVMP